LNNTHVILKGDLMGFWERFDIGDIPTRSLKRSDDVLGKGYRVQLEVGLEQ